MRATAGHLLAGRVRYAQPAEGYRSGIEPVLLAASVPARPGERVLEAGSGAGATLLCLAARVAGVRGLGIERDPALAALARDNAAANGFAGLEFAAGAIEAAALAGGVDHACANPPYHPPGTRSPVAGREAAKRATAGLLEVWARALAAPLRARGTLTLVLPAALLAPASAAITASGCGSVSLLPLWPRAGEAAKLMLLRGVKGGRGPGRVLPGLVLHEGAGWTKAATAVLRDGAGLGL